MECQINTVSEVCMHLNALCVTMKPIDSIFEIHILNHIGDFDFLEPLQNT